MEGCIAACAAMSECAGMTISRMANTCVMAVPTARHGNGDWGFNAQTGRGSVTKTFVNGLPAVQLTAMQCYQKKGWAKKADGIYVRTCMRACVHAWMLVRLARARTPCHTFRIGTPCS